MSILTLQCVIHCRCQISMEPEKAPLMPSKTTDPCHTSLAWQHERPAETGHEFKNLLLNTETAWVMTTMAITNLPRPSTFHWCTFRIYTNRREEKIRMNSNNGGNFYAIFHRIAWVDREREKIWWCVGKVIRGKIDFFISLESVKSEMHSTYFAHIIEFFLSLHSCAIW